MLLGFRTANHRSLRDEQSLLLTPVYEADQPHGAVSEAVPVAAVFGSNAAGKSNVVDALRYMRLMVVSSYRDSEPDGGVSRSPFALDEECAELPSWYVVDLLLDKIRYTYGFSIDSERVLEEWLYSYPHGRKRVLFQRGEDGISFGDAMPRRELDLVGSITEPNILFISVAARSKQQAIRPVYDWFSSSLLFRAGSARGVLPTSALRALEDSGRAQQVLGLLQGADLGIEDLGVETIEVPASRYRRRAEDRRRTPVGQATLFDDLSPGEEQPALPGLERVLRIWVQQRGRNGSVRLGLQDQSEGTRRLLEYAGPVLATLERGGVLVVDEIDSSLHPMLTARLIRLFQDAETNPQQAQLVLTTHDASLLGKRDGADILMRDQVWFVEKDEYGETRLFPLSDFKPRRNENRERKYLGGSYGAVPYMIDDYFENAVLAREGDHAGEIG